MQARCIYCDFIGPSQGIKTHVRNKHPAQYANWGFEQINGPGARGKIRHDVLRPESPKETQWYNKLKRAEPSPDGVKMVIVDGNNDPLPDGSKPLEEVKTMDEEKEVIQDDKKFQCGNCGHTFNDPLWARGEPFCPQCEEQLDKGDME